MYLYYYFQFSKMCFLSNLKINLRKKYEKHNMNNNRKTRDETYETLYYTRGVLYIDFSH